MIGHDIGQAVQPERRQSRQDLSLVWDRRRQHHVEGTDAVAGHQQQLIVPDGEQLPDLARAQTLHAVQRRQLVQVHHPTTG